MPCSELRFLVVEDHSVQRRLLAVLLRNLGAAEVHEAEDGNRALEVIRDIDRPLDIIVSDLNMPAMDGWDLVRSLGAAASPIGLIITSAVSPERLAAVARMALAYRVGLLGAVSKPVSAVKLAPLVRLYRNMQTSRAHMSFGLEEIAQALSREEFEAAFEPRVDLETARVVGMQARPRWRHPAFGLLEAEAFAPSAQSCGLLDRVLASVLRMSLEQCRLWRDHGHELRLSVSLCEGLLIVPGLADVLLRLTRAAGLEPGEVTFGACDGPFDLDRSLVIKNISQLRTSGFGLAVEYFRGDEIWSELGAGAFTEVKISRNLVSGIRLDESARAGLVQALDTARRLDLPAVAEGIESLDDWNLLQSWHCVYGQGPFIGPPLQAEGVLAWLRARRNQARAAGATGKALDLAAPDRFSE